MMLAHGETNYLIRSHAFLRTYRGLAFGVAFLLILFSGPLSSIAAWVTFACAGLYTIYKCSRRSPLDDNPLLTYADIGFDVALGGTLLLLSGGLGSPFLLYSMSPILTSALFLPKRLAFCAAGVLALSLISGQFIFGNDSPAFIAGSQLVFRPGLYALASFFLVAGLPFLINTNVYESIRSESVSRERNRLSQELHDGVTQSLGILRWKTEILSQNIAAGKTDSIISQVDEIRDILNEAEKETRRAINDLREANPCGFTAAIAQYAASFSRNYGIKCELRVNGKVALTSTSEQQLLRITKEALTNVRKHAKARNVEIAVQAGSDALEMAIRDDGTGLSSFPRSTGGYGLAIMEERARSAGGELSACSYPGQGTVIRVRMDLSSMTAVSCKTELITMGSRP